RLSAASRRKVWRAGRCAFLWQHNLRSPSRVIGTDLDPQAAPLRTTPLVNATARRVPLAYHDQSLAVLQRSLPANIRQEYLSSPPFPSIYLPDSTRALIAARSPSDKDVSPEVAFALSYQAPKHIYDYPHVAVCASDVQASN